MVTFESGVGDIQQKRAYIEVLVLAVKLVFAYDLDIVRGEPALATLAVTGHQPDSSWART